jgi:hypothetical protein
LSTSDTDRYPKVVTQCRRLVPGLWHRHLVVLAVAAAWPGGWWIDPVIGLGIAAVAVRKGIESWHGDDCY